MIGKTISHYRLLEKLGSGGMGVVYKAQDTKLDRFVALKFLPPHLSQDEENKKRFIHEAKAASALDHPNICTIYEIGEAEDGQMFIAMACYEGESLKDKIERGPLPIDEALDIAIQIAQGLAKAHSKEIIHRDIKPANILITEEGQVKIVDFGLAKLAGRTMLTKEGTTLGTVAYMSPEQAQGVEVDHRTDVWALGAVLYEMLTGRQPFAGDYEQAVMYSIMNEEPEPLTALRTGVPMELEQIVNKCLAKEADERYQSLTDLLVDLRRAKSNTAAVSKAAPTCPKAVHKGRFAWIAAVLLSLTVLAVSVLLFKSQRSSATSIAVLPFENVNKDEEMAFLCDGLAEGLINRLSLIPDFKVIARASAFTYRDKADNLQEVGQALNVRNVLVGRLAKEGKQLVISAELVDIQGNQQLWGARYRRPSAEILKLEEDIATSIANQLRVRLSRETQKQMSRVTSTHPEAYERYLKGRHLILGSRREMDRALAYFRKATELDPNFALPYAGIADALTIQAWLTTASRDQVLNEARLALRTALALNPDLSEAHKASAMIRFYFDWDWRGSEEAFRKAIELKPGNASAYEDYALLLIALERRQEALEIALKSQQLDPISIGPTHSVGIAYLVNENPIAAAEEFQKAVELHPTWAWGHTKLAMSLAQSGRVEEALDAAELAEQLTKGWGGALLQAWLSDVYTTIGKTDLAGRALDRILDRAASENVDPYAVALAYQSKGDYDNVIKFLNKAIAEKSANCVFLKASAHKEFKPLVEDARFQQLIAKMNYPE